MMPLTEAYRKRHGLSVKGLNSGISLSRYHRRSVAGACPTQSCQGTEIRILARVIVMCYLSMESLELCEYERFKFVVL